MGIWGGMVGIFYFYRVEMNINDKRRKCIFGLGFFRYMEVVEEGWSEGRRN